MSDPALDQPMSFEAAAQLDPDSHPGELERGKFLPLTKSTIRRGWLMANIAALLRSYAREHREWRAIAGDPGCKLESGPATLRGPDVGLIQRDRAPTGKGADGWLDGAPDLAVEIFGDAQPVAELLKKSVEYLAAGARMVCLVDPEAQRVIVFTQQSFPTILGREDTLDANDQFPGLTLRVAEFFDD
jgi:Uma2 family endonuclease